MSARAAVLLILAALLFAAAIGAGVAWATAPLAVVCDGEFCMMTRETWDAIERHISRLHKLVGKECI